MRIASRVLVVVAIVLGAALVVLLAVNILPKFSLFGQHEESLDSQIINAVDLVEQISLVSLGIQGITESRANSEVFGITVPGSDRATFIQYTFRGKLGMDGEDVTIVPTGESSYRVSIPEFIFIGYDDLEFKLAAENNGVLSWATAEIDSLDVVNDVLDDGAQQQYLQSNKDLFQAQAQTFYESIIHSVDPEIELEFDFSN